MIGVQNLRAVPLFLCVAVLSLTGCERLFDKGTKQQLEAALKLEENAVAMYNRAIKISRDAGDDASRELFSFLLKDEESHVDWLEMQVHQIKEIGYERYLSNQTVGKED